MGKIFLPSLFIYFYIIYSSTSFIFGTMLNASTIMWYEQQTYSTAAVVWYYYDHQLNKIFIHNMIIAFPLQQHCLLCKPQVQQQTWMNEYLYLSTTTLYCVIYYITIIIIIILLIIINLFHWLLLPVVEHKQQDPSSTENYTPTTKFAPISLPKQLGETTSRNFFLEEPRLHFIDFISSITTSLHFV